MKFPQKEYTIAVPCDISITFYKYHRFFSGHVINDVKKDSCNKCTESKKERETLTFGACHLFAFLLRQDRQIYWYTAVQTEDIIVYCDILVIMIL